MSEDLRSKTVMVIDGGSFLPLAFRLSKEFGKVLFHSPTSKPFPMLEDAALGDGFKSIERVEELWDTLHGIDVDLVVVPDVGLSDLQFAIEQIGLPVWGSRNGDVLEIQRAGLKRRQADLGMDVPPHEIVRGLPALRKYLESHDDVYVKVSKHRGLMETFHSVNGKLSQPWLDQMAVKLGPLQNILNFVVEDAIEAVVETGMDTFCIDGEFPEKVVQGVEVKNRGYIGAVTDWDDMPTELTEVNLKLAQFLQENRYRNFFSTEVRVTEDGKSYLTDPTCRMASPAGESLLALIENLGEIMYEGAFGRLVQPVFKNQFAVQAMIDHPGDKCGWRVLDLDEGNLDRICIPFCCQTGGQILLPPYPWSDATIGSVIGMGDSIEAAINDLGFVATLLEGQGLTVHTEALAEGLKAIHEEEDAGVPFTDKEVPEPATVIKE
jgi:hypothetical protein